MSNEFIEITKLIMVSGWLVFMALIDIKNMRVPNKYFKWFFIMSFGYILYNLQNPMQSIISFGVTVVITQILYKLHGIGGADIKILMILSLLYPIPIYGFPFALLVFAVAGIAVGIYGFMKISQNDQTITDIKKMKFPFVPFVLAGYLAVIITAF